MARLGDFYGRQGEYEAARVHLERALLLSQERWPVGLRATLHVRLGQALDRLGDPAAARREFERALEIDPSSPDAKRQLAGLR